MPLAGFVILLLLLWLNGIFYGFSAAVHNLSENEVEKRAQEGDKKAVFLLSLINNPVSFVNAIPLIVMASGVCFGAFIVPWATETFHPYIKHLAALILVLALVIILLASLGILTFRRIGTYHPEKYAYRYMKIVGFFTRILYPFTMCVTFIAKLAARPFGVAFNQSEDPVTEEIARRYLAELIDNDIDTLILGCTHYPLIRSTVRKVIGEQVTLVNPAYETAIELRRVLADNGLLREAAPKLGENQYQFYVSDMAEKFKVFANSIIKYGILSAKTVNIEDY